MNIKMKLSILHKHFLPALILGALSFWGSEARTSERHPVYEPAGTETAVSSQKNNLFLNAKVTASGVFENDKAEKAVDGIADKPDQYWGSENLPVWLQIDMESEKNLSAIRFWPYWADGRIYQFVIEGSPDGQSWKMLVDQSGNSITGTKEGFYHTFDPVAVRYIRTTITGNSAGGAKGGHIVEIQGFEQSQDKKLLGKAARTDETFTVNTEPEGMDDTGTVRGIAWKGERVNGRVVLWAPETLDQLYLAKSDLTGPKGAKIPLSVSFLRNTQAKGKLYADIIDDVRYVDLPAGTNRCVWVSVDIPSDAVPGVYKGSVTAAAQDIPGVTVPVEIEVLEASLPAPRDWTVHLDLWQHPEAVARWHDVKSWSPEHFSLMKPVMKHLAGAGQKVITCSLIDEAWNGQTYDWWPSMVEWTLGRDGKMRYDYANFDSYVTFMMNEVGVDKQISCYTMVPWSLKLKYFDEASGTYKDYALKPGEESYEEIWGPFLSDFKKHVQDKGWLDITCIALDERPDKMVRAAVDVINKYAPEFKVVSAVNTPSAMSDIVYDMSPLISHADTITPEILKERKEKGKKTTIYVCTSPPVPNTFTHSPLAEAEWLPVFAAANNLDGFLRWAYNSWNRDPFEKTDFGNWPSGDCFLVYPGGKSSVRFERLRDGLENFEKIRLIREFKASGNAPAEFAQIADELDQTLKQLFTVQRSRGKDHASDMEQINALILSAARMMK